MGPVRSGDLVSVVSRDVAAADTAHPNASNPTTPLRPTTRSRSRDAWVSVSDAVADAGVSVSVTIFGSVTGAANSWRVLGQLNGGAPIVPATNSGVTHTNRIAYAEAMPGVLAWEYLWPVVTGTLGQTVTVAFYGERSG